MQTICLIGASYSWTRTLVSDLLACFADEPLEIRLLDLDEEPARISSDWCRAAAGSAGRSGDHFLALTDRQRALDGADAVLITLSTGGLAAMAEDIRIPEKYGIYATVGDTAGPGGWSRSLRNIPVFQDIAADIKRLCPQAFVANYTNPMSSLTACLARLTNNPVAGFCHAYFEIKDVIQKIFGLPDWSSISVEIAGMNHFTWVTDFKIAGQSGYPLLRQKIGSGSLRDLAPAGSADEIGLYSAHNLFIELYDTYGYLPYPADRHTSEFISFALTGQPARQKVQDKEGNWLEMLDYCQITRTPIAVREKNRQRARQEMLDATARHLAGQGEALKKSRETGADMIRAYLYNETVMDAVNVPNIGQISGLPLGACVETMGVVDGFGVRPVMTGQLPEPLLELMRPQAVGSKWLLDAVLGGDKQLALKALHNDPQCAHLKPGQVRQLAEELITANRRFADLPF